MAKVVSASPDQKAKFDAAVKAIDWSKIDWSKVALILQLLVGLFANPTPKGAALGQCDHESCCLATLQATLEAASAAAHCYQTCHVDPVPPA